MKRLGLAAAVVALGLRCATAAERAAPLSAPPAMPVPALPSAAIPAAPPEAWPLLEETLATAADVPLKPGAQAAWVSLTREWLRGHPESSLPQAMAKAFAQVHALSAAQEERVAASLSQPLAPISFSGQEIKRLIQNGSEVYALGRSAIYRRDGHRWTPLVQLAGPQADVQRHDGALYVSDGESAYEIRGAQVDQVPRGSYLVSGGRLYMAMVSGLYVKDGARWRMLPGSPKMGRVRSLASIEGTLHAGSERGVFKQEAPFWSRVWSDPLGAFRSLWRGGDRWSRMRTPQAFGDDEPSIPIRLLAHEGILYVMRSLFRNTRYTTGLYTAVGKGRWGATVVEAPWNTIDAFAHGGRLYALSTHERDDKSLYEITPSGPRRLHEEGGDFRGPGPVAVGSDLFLQAEHGIYRFGPDGSHRLTSSEAPKLRSGAEHEGRRYLATDLGLAEVQGDRLEMIFPGLEIDDVVVLGREVLLATKKGIQRLFLDAAGKPWDWQPSVLGSVAREIAGAAAAASERPLLRDRGGRPLLGLGAPSAPPAPATSPVWTDLERWIGRTLELTLQPGRTRAWIDAARERLRNDPSRRLEEALADSFAAVQSLSAARRDDVVALLDGRKAIDSLPGVTVRGLRVFGSRVYAQTDEGFYLRQDGNWKKLASGLAYDLHEHAGTIYAGDGTALYAVDGAAVTPTGIGPATSGVPVEHGGRLYMLAHKTTSSGGKIWVREAGAWRVAPGTEGMGAIFTMLEHRGALYAGAKQGLFKLEGGRWKPIQNAPFAYFLLVHGGMLYALTDGGSRLYEIDRDVPRQALKERLVSGLREGAGRLYAKLSDNSLQELTPRGWRPTLDEAELPSIFGSASGDEFYVQALGQGIYRRIGDGPWLKVHDRDPSLGEIVGFRGKRYLPTSEGLYELGGDRLKPILTGSWVSGVVDDGDGLLVGTHDGIKRLPAFSGALPEDWRHAVLRDLDQPLSDDASRPAAGALLKDGKGRSLLGLQAGARP